MQRYEYRVVPAPKKGKKAKGVKTAEGRFAAALGDCMNEMAADGWEYLRTDTLPSEERAGITGRTTVFQNMLVFRRDADLRVEADGFGAAPVLVTDTEAEAEAVDDTATEEKVVTIAPPALPSATAANFPAANVAAANVAVANDDPVIVDTTAEPVEAETTDESSDSNKDQSATKAHAAE